MTTSTTNEAREIPADAVILPLRWCSWEDNPNYRHEPHTYRCEPDGPIYLCPGGDFSKTQVCELLDDETGEPDLDGFMRVRS